MAHRAGCLYRFVPVLMDRNVADSGVIVRVVPASGVGVSGRLPSRFAYIEDVDGHFYGMVCSNSLVPLTKFERATTKRILRNTQNPARFSIVSKPTETGEHVELVVYS